MIRTMLFASAVVALTAACGGKARGTDTYRADTENMLGMRMGQLQSCYDEALAQDPTLAGTVKVQFVVAKKTGVVTGAKVDPASTAPESLNSCVLHALEGLKLDPPDRNDGRATFEYAFEPRPASAS